MGDRHHRGAEDFKPVQFAIHAPRPRLRVALPQVKSRSFQGLSLVVTLGLSRTYLTLTANCFNENGL